MPLTVWDYLLSGSTRFLEVVLLVFVARNGWYRRLPVFTAYVALALACGVVRWGVYLSQGYSSWAAWYAAWVSQAVLLLARGLVVAELCWNTLRPYRGIWALTWRLLLVIALLLVFHAAVDARGDARWIVPFVLTAERGLELAAAAVLLSVLFVTAYYGIPMDPSERLVALGLCFYSAVQVLNDSLMRGWLPQHMAWWNGIRIVSFQVALLAWCMALWRRPAALKSSPRLVSEQMYHGLTTAVNFRLRTLNQRLLEILKS